MGKTKPYQVAGPVKGVNSRNSHALLTDGEFAMLRNLEMVEDVGAFSIRKGSKQFNTAALGGAVPVRGGIRWYYGATPTAETVFYHNAKVYTLAATPTEIGTTGVDPGECWFASYSTNPLRPLNDADEHYLFISQANGDVQRWDGTTYRKAGFPPVQSTAPVVAVEAPAGAGITGAYKYKMTSVYDSHTTINHALEDLHESSASPESLTANPSAQRVVISNITDGTAAAPPETAKRVYRTKAGGSIFYFLCNLGSNVASFKDETADADLSNTFTGVTGTSDVGRSLNDRAPTDNGLPPGGMQFLILFKGRLYGVGRVISSVLSRRNRVYVSAIASNEISPDGTETVHRRGVEIFPANHWIDIGDDNTPITGAAIWGDALVFFKEHEIHMLRGETAQNLQVWNTGNAVGCVAPRTIVNMGLDYGIFFLGRSESTPTVYSFKGGRAAPVSDKVEKTFRDNLLGLGSAYTVQPAAGRYRGQYLLSYATDAAPGAVYEVAKYDTRLGRWTFDRNVKPSCWIPYTGPGDAGEMFFGHAKAGWVVQWDKDGGDFDNAATTNPTDAQMIIETGWLHCGDATKRKQLKAIWVIGEAQATAKITVERRYDFRGSGTVSGCDGQVMTTPITGSSLFHHRIQAEYEGGGTAETFYFMKLLVTVDVPYAATGDPFLPVKIYSILFEYEEIEREDHRQA